MSRFTLLIYFTFLYFLSYSQDPNYFVLGAKELKNADIYSVLHTKNQKLYIATDEGLYQYKHGTMLQIEQAKEQRGTSLFNLVENSKNEVFCFNLNGQIFKIENNELKLYFQFPEKYYRKHIEMFFDDMDRLIVSSGGCFAVSDNAFEEIFYSEEYKNLKLNKVTNGDILLAISSLNKVLKIKNGKIIPLKTELNISNNNLGHHILELNTKLISSKELGEVSRNLSFNRRPKEYFNYQQISENEIWGRSNEGGLQVIKSKNGTIYIEKIYFHNIFISTLSIDNTGTIFLGTFGKGLFIIPNRRAETFNNIIPGNNLKHIAVDHENVYISDMVEGIFVYNLAKNKTTIISENRPHRLFTFKKNKSDLYQNYPNLFHGFKIGNGDLKNIFELDSSTFLMASSNGLLKIGPTNIIDENLWEEPNFKQNVNIKISKLFTKRCTDVAYDLKEKTLYVSTMTFLNALKPNGEISELNYNGFPIIANDLLFEDGLLWCATQNFGILVFKNNKIVKQINTDSGLYNNYVFKLEKKSNLLYISHKTGFQIFSISTQEWMTIGTAEGIENGTVKDFCIKDDKIWFISNNKIISYPIAHANSDKPEMSISFDSIKVNDLSISLNEPGNFTHNDNNLAIYPVFNGLLYESEVNLQYTLENNDNNQILQRNSLSITDDIIEFKYLPSGNYNFYIASKYRDSEKRSAIFHFKISKAYWQTTWFLIASILILLGILSFLYKYRTRIIRKENLEKLEKQALKTEAIKAELKAIRSQMNPHFIFNSLNSIQDLILKEDTEASYDYLVLFSELVRNALSYSNQNLISLEKEILFLQSYLKLEKLRFGSDFEFNISNKAPNGLVIPSLVIQPFVENAIAHGVFHKKGKKLIEINLFCTEDNLICTVQDNGMGRAYSKKIHARSSKKHQSFALDAISKRLQFLEIEYGSNIGYEIEDLVKNHTFQGTKVIVRLPLVEKKLYD